MRETETAIIKSIKENVRLKEWNEEIRECRSSGLTVIEWCRQNNVNVKNYYYHLRRVRKCLCENQCSEIVPVSLPVKKNHNEIRIEKNGLQITLPADISSETLTVLIRELC